MSIIKIMKLIIIACFVVLGYAQTGPAEDFTIDHYLGIWYDVGGISRQIYESDFILCEWRNVTQEYGESVKEAFTFIFLGGPITSVGNVTLTNSELRIKYSDAEGAILTYRVKSYNDGNDLILLDVEDEVNSVLVSRDTTASPEATKDFEQLAADKGGYVVYIGNEKCF